jgi:F420-dependent oxidoreductase-like protein
VSLKVGISAVPVSRPAIDYVVEAERLGVDSVWVPEFWGYDAFTPLGALAVATDTIRLGTGIVQLGARTPAMLAMSALTLQELSAGRFLLGIGASGPQVVEGWHGVPFARPIRRTRETIDIVRLVTAGERLEYDGEIYQLPLPDGEGRALRAAAQPAHVPIYIASLGPANLALTGELADGWIGNSFFPETAHVFFDRIAEGARTAGRSLDDIDLTVAMGCEFTDDVREAGRRHASGYAFTFGAMGSAKTNFYNDAFARQGFGDDVAEVQRLWAAGDHEAARARVPIEIGLGTNLIGPPDEIRRRLRRYRDSGVDTLRVGPAGETNDECLDCLGQLLDLVAEVNAEVDANASSPPDPGG